MQPTRRGSRFDDEGFVVREAVDGQDAIESLEQDPPHAMVLDLMMPRVDGHGVLRARREEGLAEAERLDEMEAAFGAKKRR